MREERRREGWNGPEVAEAGAHSGACAGIKEREYGPEHRKGRWRGERPWGASVATERSSTVVRVDEKEAGVCLYRTMPNYKITKLTQSCITKVFTSLYNIIF